MLKKIIRSKQKRKKAQDQGNRRPSTGGGGAHTRNYQYESCAAGLKGSQFTLKDSNSILETTSRNKEELPYYLSSLNTENRTENEDAIDINRSSSTYTGILSQ